MTLVYRCSAVAALILGITLPAAADMLPTSYSTDFDGTVERLVEWGPNVTLDTAQGVLKFPITDSSALSPLIEPAGPNQTLKQLAFSMSIRVDSIASGEWFDIAPADKDGRTIAAIRFGYGQGGLQMTYYGSQTPSGSSQQLATLLPLQTWMSLSVDIVFGGREDGTDLMTLSFDGQELVASTWNRDYAIQGVKLTTKGDPTGAIDNFAISTPEPSALALLGGSAIALLGGRRRG